MIFHFIETALPSKSFGFATRLGIYVLRQLRISSALICVLERVQGCCQIVYKDQNCAEVLSTRARCLIFTFDAQKIRLQHFDRILHIVSIIALNPFFMFNVVDEHLKVRKNKQQKTCNFAAKRVELRCSAFYYPHQTC